VSDGELIRDCDALLGEYDLEACARSIPDGRGLVVKGIFFHRHVDILGSEWDSVVQTLSAPPARGRYLVFGDYHSADYIRVSGHAARKRYPGVGSREALRRLAREDFDVFATSTLGRVVMSVISDPRAALHKSPFVYEKMSPGDWRVVVTDVDEHTLSMDFMPYYGRWEYALGQIEGVVLHYRPTSTIRVRELSEQRVRFEVDHSRRAV
jgi:uncharacterized protein (TIGR02265 family)